MSRQPRVLLVDDEPKLRASLTAALAGAGFEVVEANDGLAALSCLAAGPYDVVVLDVAMPILDGFETCRRIRDAGHEVPVLMLTARDEVDDRVRGFEAGADDYVIKPFALRELIARLGALVKRAGRDGSGAPLSVLEYDDLRVDRVGRRAWRGDDELGLTRTEFLLLEQLALHPEQVLERRTLLLRVWGYDFEGDSNALTVYISYLRRKMEAGGRPRLVWTVRAVGYVLRRGDA